MRVREIEGKCHVNFSHGRQELVRNVGSFEKSKVQKIAGKITVFDGSKSKGNLTWFELIEGSKNWDSTVILIFVTY